MKKYQKTALLEVVERTQCGGYLVQNEGDSSDRWVIPQVTFESTYQEVPDSELLYSTDDLKEMKAEFGFDIAICLLKEGEKVARKGWNEKGMFIYLVKGTTVDKENLRNEAYKHVGNCESAGDSTGVVTINPHIDMKAEDGTIVVGWLASQTDILAKDWEIID